MALRFRNLGWINLTSRASSIGWVYRAGSPVKVGNSFAHYNGDYAVTPAGDYETWARMVREEVVGHPALEVVLLAGLSAVVNGLISKDTTGENPIVHLCGASSTGKSTAGMLAVSAFGSPMGEIDPKTGATQRSLYSTWGATKNATIRRLAGNHGAPFVLNELGKPSKGK